MKRFIFVLLLLLNNEKIFSQDYRCGETTGKKNSFIEIFDPTIKNDLRGLASFRIFFNNKDSMVVDSLEMVGLYLIDTSKNEIIYDMFRPQTKDSIFVFYELELEKIIKNFHCWIEGDYNGPKYTSLMLTISFKSHPIKND